MFHLNHELKSIFRGTDFKSLFDINKSDLRNEMIQYFATSNDVPLETFLNDPFVSKQGKEVTAY